MLFLNDISSISTKQHGRSNVLPLGIDNNLQMWLVLFLSQQNVFLWRADFRPDQSTSAGHRDVLYIDLNGGPGVPFLTRK